MALSDIIVKQDSNGVGEKGAEVFAVAASATLINAGDPVIKALGNTTGYVVAPMATDSPIVSGMSATTPICGVATTTSTNTASAVGTVKVLIADSAVTFLISPNDPTAWATQTLYNALVGSRVLMDLSNGVYTILSTDDPTYGCVIEPLDISVYPGKVAFKFRAASSYLA
jgi:hypothetical protein